MISAIFLPRLDAVCRDLVIPCIDLLACFIEAVDMRAEEASE